MRISYILLLKTLIYNIINSIFGTLIVRLAQGYIVLQPVYDFLTPSHYKLGNLCRIIVDEFNADVECLVITYQFIEVGFKSVARA